MDNKILESIERIVRDSFPREACGVVLNSGCVLKLPNMAHNPEESFSIAPIDFYKLRQEVAYIFHSHTKKKLTLHICTPSLADVQAQKKWEIPFLIAGFDGGYYTPPIELPAQPNKELLNRPYIYGISDCGYLMRDYYLYNFDMVLEIDPELAVQPKSFWPTSVKLTLERNNFKDLGPAVSPRNGDILINSVGGGIANHGAIYVGTNSVLVQNDVSSIEPLEMFKDSIYTIYRHEKFL